LQEVRCKTQPESTSLVHLEVLRANDVWLRVGDCVYIDDIVQGLPRVYRCDRLWRDDEGRAFASGPWLARPIGAAPPPVS